VSSEEGRVTPDDQFPAIGANEYMCDACGGVFEKCVSDDEAVAEANELFPVEAQSGQAFGIVCDDCFQTFRAWQGHR
jgi:hypothetical protein